MISFATTRRWVRPPALGSPWLRWLTVASTLGALAAALPEHARADDEVRVRLSLPVTGLPFSAHELETAVETRLFLERGAGPADDVTVTPTPVPGTVIVISSRRLEEVAIEGKSPADAARLVALAVVSVTRPSAPIAVARVATTTDVGPKSGGSRLRAGAATGVSVGLSGHGLTVETNLEAAWAFGAQRTWQLLTAVGFAYANARVVAYDVRLYTVPVRVGIARRWQHVTVGAGPVLRGFGTGGLAGEAGVLAGGFASVSVHGALSRDFHARLTLSCDANPQRLVFRAESTEVFTAGPFIPWLGFGVSWGRA